MPLPADPALRLAVVGAGPVGLALALYAARMLPGAAITVFDARPAEQDVSADPRTLALSLGSVQLLRRLRAWPAAQAQPITEVHVSQQPPTLPWGRPEVRIRAIDEGVPLLGAVLAYGALVAPLQRAWLGQAGAHRERLRSRFGMAVTALKPVPGGIEVDAGIVETFDVAVVAEGGVFRAQPQEASALQPRSALRHDYAQTAWVGEVLVRDAAPGVAFERFTRHGPAALLPLLPQDGAQRAALVWCVASHDDPVRSLDAAQRLAVLNTVFPPEAGRIVSVGPLRDFALGLTAERTLVRGRSVRIGNAAQTLHPVAGQGLNLGLRDAVSLVHALRHAAGIGVEAALRRVEWQRAPDRWSMIAATDFLARSFTWRAPGLGSARGLALALLDRAAPLKSALARHMMFGRR